MTVINEKGESEVMYIENIIPKSAAEVVSMAPVVSDSIPSQQVIMEAPVVSVSENIPSQQVIINTTAPVVSQQDVMSASAAPVVSVD